MPEADYERCLISLSPGRRGAPGPDQAARVRGVRHGVHAPQPARRDDGEQRGRLRRLLPVPPARRHARTSTRRRHPLADARPPRAHGSDAARLDFGSSSCPMPLRDSPVDRDGSRRRRRAVGRARRAPLRARPSATAAPCEGLGDSTVLSLGGARLAFSTDSYVVRPMFFPGGSIGDLAVNGTVNDLAMSGAQAGLPVVRVHPRGGHRLSTSSAGSPQAMGAAARQRRRQHRHRRHQGGRRRARRRRLRQHRRIGLVPEGSTSARERARPGRRRHRQRRRSASTASRSCASARGSSSAPRSARTPRR